MSITTPYRPRRADAERNRARILAAASELFAERGLDASMPDLADRAGVGIGTVYRAFPDKDHLLGAVMAERFRWLADEIEAAARTDDPWIAFTDVVWKGAALHAKDRAFHQLMPQAAGLPEVQEARGRTLDAFQRLLERREVGIDATLHGAGREARDQRRRTAELHLGIEMHFGSVRPGREPVAIDERSGLEGDRVVHSAKAHPVK